MPDFDAQAPSIARVYDYVLGGSDNFAADREQGDRLIAVFPAAVEVIRENRQFLARAVAWAANQGVRQFIDLGCGMPTAPNSYETAQAVNPDARVVCIDRDTVALSHLRAVVEKGRPGLTVVDGDAGDPGAILGAVSESLDLTAPTCLVMGLLLHFYDPDAVRSLMADYVAALAPGSHVVISLLHGNGEDGERWFSTYSSGVARGYNYSVAEITAFLDGMELVPPGVVDACQWHPDWSVLPPLPFRAGQSIVGVARVRGH